MHPAVRRIYVFRHGQTDWNVEGRIQGHLDVHLNETGRAQARRLARHTRRLGLEACLSSDLTRARETATIVAAASGAPVFTDPGLREIHLGKMQGLTRLEIIARFGEKFADRNTPLSDEELAFLGSESGEQVRVRALGAIERFLAAHPFRRVGVATHGGVIRRLIEHAWPGQGFPPPVPNGAFYPFRWDGARWELDDQMPLR
jgi:probable phosphoglycerate mutase